MWQQLFIRPIASGRKELLRFQIVVGILQRHQIARLSGEQIGRAAPSQSIHMAVGMIGSWTLPVAVGPENVLSQGIAVPVFGILPYLTEVPILCVSGHQ